VQFFTLSQFVRLKLSIIHAKKTGVVLSILVTLRAASILSFFSFLRYVFICKVQRKEENILPSEIMQDFLGFVQPER
jgi:predicted neutral ceramidase superfamily lipid hydrolase